jgi:hypothetical protein
MIPGVAAIWANLLGGALNLHRFPVVNEFQFNSAIHATRFSGLGWPSTVISRLMPNQTSQKWLVSTSAAPNLPEAARRGRPFAVVPCWNEGSFVAALGPVPLTALRSQCSGAKSEGSTLTWPSGAWCKGLDPRLGRLDSFSQELDAGYRWDDPPQGSQDGNHDLWRDV